MLNLSSEVLLEMFMTEENKKVLQEKVTQAIARIDVDELSSNIQEVISSIVVDEGLIADLIDYDKVGDEATSMILKAMKSQLSK